MLINIQIETRTINFEIDKVLGEISGKGITENAENCKPVGIRVDHNFVYPGSNPSKAVSGM